MTAFDQIRGLVSAHTSRDHDRFRAITLQIAANLAARSPSSAEQLRKLMERSQALSLLPLPSAKGLLSVPSKIATLDDMVLAPQIRERLERVVMEQDRRLELHARGLQPARKLLFVGEPGVGKSMAAGALSAAIGLPMYRVDLHGVISSHLGETASKLAQVFEHVRSMPAVYLFDEFDALGGERGGMSGEAGSEMRRVVNSLLQFIESDQSEGLIIAATNHEQLLDSAIFRRFDEVVTFDPLTISELVVLIERALRQYAVSSLDYPAIFSVNPKLGHADLCAVLDRARKNQVLDGSPIDTQCIVEGVRSRTQNSSVELFA